MSLRSVGSPPVNEEDRICFPPHGAQQLNRLLRGKLLAEDVRLLLCAVNAIEVASARGVEDRGVGRDAVGSQGFATTEVLEVMAEILQDERVAAREAAQKGNP
jgi:hypothetical protein